MGWKRIVTGVVAVAALAATVLGVSASAAPDPRAARPVPPKPSPSGPPPPFLSIGGSGAITGILITAQRQALYYNDQDAVPATVCSGTCAMVWHPLRPPAAGTMVSVPGLDTQIGVVTRPDGTRQVTFAGKPLYTFTVDGKGNVTGDRLIDTFHGRAYSWHAATATGQPLPSGGVIPPGQPAPGASGPPLPGQSGQPLPGQPLPGQSGLPLPGRSGLPGQPIPPSGTPGTPPSPMPSVGTGRPTTGAQT